MADETIDRKAADAEAQADAKAVAAQDKDAEKVVEKRRHARDEDQAEVGPRFVNTVPVAEGDFPSVEDKNVNVLSSDRVDPNEGWTAQSEVGYVDQEKVPGYYVQKHELPTKEGLAAHGIDPVEYVSGVPVRK